MINDAVLLNMIKYKNKPIKFIVNVNEDVPSELIGDELRIKQILNNLLSNAFKYTDEGEVELSLNPEFVLDFSADKSGVVVFLVFRVRDTGRGMTKEHLENLFQDYSSFNLNTSRTIEGVGLGMSITKYLISLMNGTITVESEPGKGTLFTFRFPQGNAGAQALGKEAVEKLRKFRLNFEAKMKKVHVAHEPIPFGKVLVVDDIDMNLYVAKGMLSLYGLQIDTAASGHEAIKKIKQNKYDLVFMDHMMPVMNGIETTQKIRELGSEYRELLIIALTANAVSGMKEMFLNNGFDGFISKPIVIQELDDLIRKFMSPEKINKQTERKTSEPDTINENFLAEIKKISEIDTEAGLSQLSGKKKVYKNTLDIFHKKLTGECNNMSAFLDTGDFHNFTISIHAMKSMLAIIGALKLSQTAYELETASQNQETDYCIREFPGFKEKLLSLHNNLTLVFSGTGKDNTGSNNAENTDNNNLQPELKQGKILLVDDMEMLLFVVKEKLSRYGLLVDTATSGFEAIEKIKSLHVGKNAYDLILMDQMMPKMSGIEATAIIRKWENEEKIKNNTIIALTANTETGIKEKFLENGFNDFLSKPVKTPELEGILKKWLS
jgi:CheY-like chemotaxis protein